MSVQALLGRCERLLGDIDTLKETEDWPAWIFEGEDGLEGLLFDLRTYLAGFRTGKSDAALNAAVEAPLRGPATNLTQMRLTWYTVLNLDTGWRAPVLAESPIDALSLAVERLGSGARDRPLDEWIIFQRPPDVPRGTDR